MDDQQLSKDSSSQSHPPIEFKQKRDSAGIEFAYQSIFSKLPPICRFKAYSFGSRVVGPTWDHYRPGIFRMKSPNQLVLKEYVCCLSSPKFWLILMFWILWRNARKQTTFHTFKNCLYTFIHVRLYVRSIKVTTKRPMKFGSYKMFHTIRSYNTYACDFMIRV